ncbi:MULTISPECIES: succinate dehydrogenase, cytochrome b556 subunit [Sphingomonadaceae]|jgi:succinate dehydrogenase / fumarate reductase, cytochrome b subunit|uniref:Succinate dehydrogenase cytochrome b556 subunit n=1 Tax=Sphingobium soli TaxID=1591116 RepID=A0ABS8H088_9SPHN|nr:MULTISPECIES: succinate dehydrogenase, cytochrome b556 subunit [Sphingomonadaceae]MEC9016426.1 succinate dehydrogenase, cytochrome b556 subunit [Pseudomonadota bacterium]MAP45354.1 succinate dehydrogenase, cytochrome b556 subunit [Sphingobium sp.]MBA37614.1 succinate dehydrogenase, cytochrome b556 subunit [Sphingobium sp.]MBS47806.1 succinate dehydrogenase, cytochrome b556 subunit [Sphingobium sp.]MCC4231152.1 succinate dehydrogenase, cytochrome b556 subunit [Sphingobium soli]|tara:strand:- start:634 stop:1032 length:399 start_codon:yes stop_codon:yes gene_type:complete
MARTSSRPLSPHLTIWKWGPHMAVSIMHRVTGNGLATVGALGLVWWLMAAAIGPEAYATFVSCATSPIGYLVMIGLSWFFFQHLCSGLRHFVLDMGAGYELRTNKSWSIGVFLAGAALTILFWAYIFFGKAF